MVNTKKYELYNNIVKCTHHSQENKMHTSQHQCIRYDYRKPSLKIRLDSPENVNNTPFWHQSHFMQTIRLHKVVGTHTKGMKHTNIERCIHLSHPNNMHTSHHQYIHYRKPSLKIRPPTLQKPPRVCKQHYTCSNPAKWKVIGQPVSTDHHCY